MNLRGCVLWGYFAMRFAPQPGAGTAMNLGGCVLLVVFRTMLCTPIWYRNYNELGGDCASICNAFCTPRMRMNLRG